MRAPHQNSRIKPGSKTAAALFLSVLIGVSGVGTGSVQVATASTHASAARAGPPTTSDLHRSAADVRTRHPVREYVALGDSWTAGVVVVNADGFPETRYAPIGCAQSRRNYPKLVAQELGVHRFRDASCGPATDEDMSYIKTKFDQVNAMLRRAARTAGAEYVSTANRSRGHDLCTGAKTRYAETLGISLNDPAIGFPAHPNAAGARAQAASVLDYLRSHAR